MSYAQPQDVLARSGPLLGPFTNVSTPTAEQVQTFLDQGSALVDSIVGGMGVGTPVTGAIATAFGTLVADYALVLSLIARYPGATGAQDATGMALQAAQQRVSDGFAQLENRTFPGMASLLESGQAAQPSTLPMDEPLYGIWPPLPSTSLAGLYAPHGAPAGAQSGVFAPALSGAGGQFLAGGMPIGIGTRYPWANPHLDPQIYRGMKL